MCCKKSSGHRFLTQLGCDRMAPNPTSGTFFSVRSNGPVRLPVGRSELLLSQAGTP